jgi:hypothetical protein
VAGLDFITPTAAAKFLEPTRGDALPRQRRLSHPPDLKSRTENGIFPRPMLFARAWNVSIKSMPVANPPGRRQSQVTVATI